MPTTQDLVNLVLRDYEINNRRTPHSVRSHAKNLLRLLAQLPTTALEIEEYKVTRVHEGGAASTIKNELTILRRGFSLAKKFELVDKVPQIDAPSVENIRTVVATNAQVRMILAALEVLDPDVADLVRWLVLMGWRRGEAQKLIWDDFRADRQFVTLPQDRSKNKKPRPVKLGWASHELVEKRWRLRKGSYVFHRQGYRIRHFRGVWRTACTGAGIQHLRPHDLRRQFAQNAFNADVPVPVIMSIAGWKTMSTLIRYGIANEEMQASGQDLIASCAGF